MIILCIILYFIIGILLSYIVYLKHRERERERLEIIQSLKNEKPKIQINSLPAKSMDKSILDQPIQVTIPPINKIDEINSEELLCISLVATAAILYCRNK